MEMIRVNRVLLPDNTQIKDHITYVLKQQMLRKNWFDG